MVAVPSFVVVAACAFGIVVTSAPFDARACSPAQVGVWDRYVLPGDGAQGVPTNAHITLIYNGFRVQYTMFAAPVVRRAGGAEVAGVTTTTTTERTATLVFVPDAPLEPDAEYEVLDDLCIGCGRTADIYGARTVVARFTTGAARDDATPPAPSEATATVRLDECDDSACCGPYRARVVDLAWAELPADTLGQVFVDGVLTAFTTDHRALGWMSCGGAFSPGWDFGEPGVVSLRHVDVAGNVSDAVVVPFELPACPSPHADPAAEPVPDAAAEVTDPTPTPDDGCHGGGLELLATLAAIALRVRPRVDRRGAEVGDVSRGRRCA